jgi:UDP-N-acetyl-D-glucosamine/UDP-N-acetyl-D-galactosamine dehydrogenase
MTFKENCPDIRNTRVVDIVREFQDFGAVVDVHDPWVSAAEAEVEYGIRLVAEPAAGDYDAIVVAVAHSEFRALGAAGIRRLGKPDCILYDIKSLLPAADVDGRL